MNRLLHSLLLFSAVAFSIHLATAQGTISPSTMQNSSGKGVHFEHSLTWAQAKAKAIAEHKYLFADCFTTWCGPCRYMRDNVFPQAEAGDFFNDKFVSVEVQLDTTAKDNDHVKSWYADAHALMTQYSINAFPTYLIFAPDGQIVHRLVGSTRTAKDFIGMVKQSFDTSMQYYTQLRQFDAGRMDSAFLGRLAKMAINLYDLPTGARVFKLWLKSQPDIYNRATLEMMTTLTQRSADPWFPVFLDHGDKVDQVLGAGKADQLVNNILMREYAQPLMQKAGATGPDWKDIQKSIAAKYPARAAEVTARAKVLYFEMKSDWPNFKNAVGAYMQQWGTKVTPEELNSWAWAVFSNCPDMSCVAEALDWSRRSFKDKPDPGYIDTYANILYKMGKKDDAITWEQKAMDLAAEGDKAGYQSVIDKMKKGEKTWN